MIALKNRLLELLKNFMDASFCTKESFCQVASCNYVGQEEQLVCLPTLVQFLYKCYSFIRSIHYNQITYLVSLSHVLLQQMARWPPSISPVLIWILIRIPVVPSISVSKGSTISKFQELFALNKVGLVVHSQILIVQKESFGQVFLVKQWL